MSLATKARPRNGALFLALILTLLLALAGSAHASGAVVYCVSDPSCPVGGIAESGLQAAFNAADALSTGSSATVDLGPGTFASAAGFLDSSGDLGENAISVVGAGEGSTILTATNSGADVLDFNDGTNADAHASVSNLTVDMPGGAGPQGVVVPQTITNVSIVGSPASTDALGLRSQNTVATNVTITMALGTGSTGVARPNGTMTANGLTIKADTGIAGGGTQDSYSQLRVFADVDGLSVTGSNGSPGAASTLTNSEIVMTGNGTALEWNEDQTFEGTLNASFLTIVGNNTAGSEGVAALGLSSGNGTVNLSDSIVVGFAQPLYCSSGGSASAAIDATYSDFNSAADFESCSGLIQRANDINANPAFVTLADGDETVPFNSPVVGAGNPTITGPPTDLLGHARPGVGSAHVSMGAFEYQFVAPTAAASATPTSLSVGAPVTFSAAGSSDLNP
jgi:hypothetical protein